MNCGGIAAENASVNAPPVPSWQVGGCGRYKHRTGEHGGMTAIDASIIDQLLTNFGYLAVFVAVGIESLGIPVPGETMLITASIYAGHTHNLTIQGVIGAAIAGAIIGDNIGYLLGYQGGYRLLLRYAGRLHINERNLKIARYLFDRRGAPVVFFGRFVSILRTYTAFLAGVSHMRWMRFFAYNAAGGIAWAVIFGLLGYYGQQTFRRLSTPVDIALAVVALAVAVGLFLYLRRHADRLADSAERAYPGPLSRHADTAAGAPVDEDRSTTEQQPPPNSG
jgi:membrane protein DedA with SNARE-associated domain